MIFDPSQYARLSEKIPKAGMLSDLYENNLPVPPFVVISSDEFTEGVSSSLLEIIFTRLPVSSYAVRFASCHEDTKAQSAAGRFHSVIGVPREELEQSIKEVLDKSVPLAKGAPYVLIIQQAVVADISGVIFSRDPFNSRYIQLEQGRGTSSVVSGDADTETLRFLIGQPILSTNDTHVAMLVDLATKIEQLLDFPQDIEWCVRDSHVYLVQSRPISTYTQADWQGIKLVDTAVAGKDRVYWQKSEGMETYSYPTPLDFSILNFLHTPLGAVATAYTRLGLRYTATDHYILIGNTLYVNKEKEQQQLLPSYSIVEPLIYRLRYFPLAKLITTASNYTQLGIKVSAQVVTGIINELRLQLTSEIPAAETIPQMLEILTVQYQTIFIINHLIVRGELESLVKTDPSITERIKLLRQYLPSDLVPGVTHGNSLALADESLFARANYSNSNPVDELREVARWQSVRLHTFMKKFLRRTLAEKNIDETLLNFFSIKSWQQGNFDTHSAEVCRDNYQYFKDINFPETISTFKTEEKDDEVKVLSTGVAQGLLVDSLPIKICLEKPILYTDTLSPQIIPHLGNVSGVICRYGGTLSHCAIVARELRLPVVKISSNFQRKIGHQVSINTNLTQKEIINFENKTIFD